MKKPGVKPFIPRPDPVTCDPQSSMRFKSLACLALLTALHFSCLQHRYKLQSDEGYEIVRGTVVQIDSEWIGLSCEQHHEEYRKVLFKLADTKTLQYIFIKYHQADSAKWPSWTRNKRVQSLKLIKPDKEIFEVWRNPFIPGVSSGYSAGPPPPPKHIVSNYPKGENPPYGQKFRVYCYYDKNYRR